MYKHQNIGYTGQSYTYSKITLFSKQNSLTQNNNAVTCVDPLALRVELSSSSFWISSSEEKVKKQSCKKDLKEKTNSFACVTEVELIKIYAYY